MSAREPADGHADQLASDRHALGFDPYIAPYPPGTGDGDYPLVLAVEVYHPSRLEHGEIERLCAAHAHLLVRGEDAFERGVRDVGRGKQRHHIDHRRPVVAAERGAACAEHAVLDIQVEPVLFKIVDGRVILFADHVDVSLHRDDRFAFHAGGRRFFDKNVVRRVFFVLKAEFGGEIAEETGYLFLVLRAARNGADRLEIRKRRRGLKPRGYCLFKFHIILPKYNKIRLLTYILQAPVFYHIRRIFALFFAKFLFPSFSGPSRAGYFFVSIITLGRDKLKMYPKKQKNGESRDAGERRMTIC